MAKGSIRVPLSSYYAEDKQNLFKFGITRNRNLGINRNIHQKKIKNYQCQKKQNVCKYADVQISEGEPISHSFKTKTDDIKNSGDDF